MATATGEGARPFFSAEENDQQRRPFNKIMKHSNPPKTYTLRLFNIAMV